MAAETSLPKLLESLTQSLASAQEATPAADRIKPPADGVSLLDVKNDLLLSYLQHLVFFILNKTRHQARRSNDVSAQDAEQDFHKDVIHKLVQLRLYLEKGVHHIEDKLSHTLSTVLRAANDSERQSRSSAKPAKLPTTATLNGTGSGSDVDSVVSSSEDDGSDNDDDDNNNNATTVKPASGPNLAAFAPPKSATRGMAASSTAAKGDKPAVYKAPKINPTMMPTTERRTKPERRPNKSRTMDEYIATEFSAAPIAEPSIGTTIVRGGRKLKTDSERRDEALRQEYEEMNLVRLPKKSKKDEAREARLAGRKMVFGGEEFRELGEGVDRIARLTRRKGGEGGGGTRGLLEKSRKRGIDTVDGPRGSGAAIGGEYRKRLKRVDGKPRRKR